MGRAQGSAAPRVIATQGTRVEDLVQGPPAAEPFEPGSRSCWQAAPPCPRCLLQTPRAPSTQPEWPQSPCRDSRGIALPPGARSPVSRTASTVFNAFRQHPWDDWIFPRCSRRAVQVGRGTQARDRHQGQPSPHQPDSRLPRQPAEAWSQHSSAPHCSPLFPGQWSWLQGGHL